MQNIFLYILLAVYMYRKLKEGAHALIRFYKTLPDKLSDMRKAACKALPQLTDESEIEEVER